MSEPVDRAVAPKLLAMRGITKRFPGVVALADVSLELSAGEVLALVGENGAGKSTLMKILGGAYWPDEGEILLDRSAVRFHNVHDAKRHGIALIHQELMLAPNLDIASNIFLGNERRRWGILNRLDRAAMIRESADVLHRVGLNLSPTMSVSSLTAGQMQMVEITKALSQRARLIIMDEPTSSLTVSESEHLFRIIDTLRRQGIGIIYISHRLDEVLRLSDRVMVLRDGRNVGELPVREATHDKLVFMMVGRALSRRFPDRPEKSPAEPLLVVRNLLVLGAPEPVSFTAFRGEILGFAGLVGAGRTELMQTICGVTPAQSGHMVLDGKPFIPRNIRDGIDRGVYLAPEDRKRHGLVLPMSVAQNTSLPDVAHYSPAGLLRRDVEHRVAQEQVNRLSIKTPTIHHKAINLSGGNQQKVVLGKWLAMRPKVLILDEPTRGIDVGAKAEIYRQIAELAGRGITILLVSSEMEEIIGMSDRVVVMHERRIRGILPHNQLTQENIARLMTGQKRDVSIAPAEDAVASGGTPT